MSTATTEFSHQELSLLLFALEGRAAEGHDLPPSCEEACPVVEHLETVLGGQELSPEKQLARHLNNHLREGLIECGMFELVGSAQAGGPAALSAEDQAKLRQINERLNTWNCRINLDATDRRLLGEAVSRLPRSAWLSMPRTLWRLRKKLKSG